MEAEPKSAENLLQNYLNASPSFPNKIDRLIQEYWQRKRKRSYYNWHSNQFGLTYDAMLSWLVQRGAKIDSITNLKGDTLLLELLNDLHCDYKEKIDFLLALGANVNARNNKGQGVFHRNVLFREKLLQLLLEKGASVTYCDIKGNTPLHYFMRSNNELFAR